MTSLKIATITFATGLGGYTLIMIASNLFHKIKKKRSFAFSDNPDEVIVKNNITTNIFNTAGHFFLYSLLTCIVAANQSMSGIYFQLAGIYTFCLILVLIEFYYRKKFAVIIDKKKRRIRIKNQEYPLSDFPEFEVSARSFWMTDDFDSYGLYIKSSDNSTKLVYGYSILKDIQQLKIEIDTRLNS